MKWTDLVMYGARSFSQDKMKNIERIIKEDTIHQLMNFFHHGIP